MATAISRSNLDYFPPYPHQGKQINPNGDRLSGLSLYDLQPGFATNKTASSPESPSYPAFTDTYQLPTSDDWLNWEKEPLSPETEVFPKVEPFESPITQPLAINPLELSTQMPDVSSFGLDDLDETPNMFDGPASPRRGKVEAAPLKQNKMYDSRSTSTATTGEDARYPSRKRKSSSSGSAKSYSRSSISPDPQMARRRSIPGSPPKKTAHNMIEKRYRNNLNDKIAALRDSVPSLRIMVNRLEQQSSEDGDEEMDGVDLGGLTPAHKLNKATILSKATEYIAHLERRNKNLAKDNAALRNRVEGFEALVMNRDGQSRAAGAGTRWG